MPNAIRYVIIIIIIIIIINPPFSAAYPQPTHNTHIAFHLGFLYGVTEGGGYVFGLN